MTLNERIREIRIKRGLTQREVGERAHIAEPTIRKYESGRLNPKYATLEKIASALDVPVLALMGYVFIRYTEDGTPVYGPPPTVEIDIDKPPPQFTRIEIHDLSKTRKQPIISHDSSVENLAGLEQKKPTPEDEDGLSDMEQELIRLFRELNQEGQEQLVDTADTMVSSGKYKKSGAAELGKRQA